MFDLSNSTETRLENSIEKLRKLKIEIERIEQLEIALFQNEPFTRDQLTIFFEDLSNFTNDEISHIQSIEKDMEKRLKTLLDNLPKPLEAKQKRKDLEQASSWIPIR